MRVTARNKVKRLPGRRRGQAVCLMAIASLSCAEAPSNSPDSPEPEAVLVETARISGTDLELSPIGAVAVAHDGAIVFAQPVDQSLRVFTSAGRPVHAFGGAGEGPGEFARLARLSWHADTLVAHDPGQGRLTLFTSDYEVARTYSYPTTASPIAAEADSIPTFPIVLPLALRSEGSVVARLMTAGGDVPESFRATTTIGRVSSTGQLESILARVPSAGTLETPHGVLALPFPNRTLNAVSPSGDRVAVAYVRLDGSAAGRLHVTTIDSRNGDTIYAAEISVPVEAIPSRVADSVVSRGVEALKRSSPELAAAFEQEVTIPDFYPPLTDLFVADDGSVYAELRDRGQGREYGHFGSDGVFVGYIRLPSRSKIGVPGTEGIWVIERDALDVESLVAYDVEWR